MRCARFTLCVKRIPLNETSLRLKTRKKQTQAVPLNHGAEISSVFEDPKAKSEADTYGGVKEK
jgi:hypothetical protein